MEQVAAEAGVARQTVYNHFASKEALFAAIVGGLVDQLSQALPDPAGGPSDARAGLMGFARRLLAMIVDPVSVGLHRMLVTEAPRHPELARAVFAAGPVETEKRLAAYLRRLEADGALAVPDAGRAAEQLIGALRGHVQLRLLFMSGEPPDERRLEAAATSAVEAFLRAHRPD